MKVTVIGGSGYTGGELLRLLTIHPEVDEIAVTSERFSGKYVRLVHPNLRGSGLRFTNIADLRDSDIIFSCLPHGRSFDYIEEYMSVTDRVIDLSADFRLNSKDSYQRYYAMDHPYPEFLESFIYGIPELHREEMRGTSFISSAGCNATAAILPLYPLLKTGIQPNQIIIDAKVGVSEAGRQKSESSSFVERERSLRSYQLTGHRHVAEIVQELNLNSQPYFTATSIPIVRGVLLTIQVLVSEHVTEKELWRLYRDVYQNEPFVDIIKERSGNFRYPDPKTLMGSNRIQVGFEIDEENTRIVLVSALDNLMKGAAGQAVQGMNLMMGYSENTGLSEPGFYIY